MIVLIHEMNYALMKRTPAVEPETDLAYSKMGWTACSLADYIREIGYKAIPAGNELGLSIRFAVDAGLGELGRLGLLMTREFGPREMPRLVGQKRRPLFGLHSGMPMEQAQRRFPSRSPFPGGTWSFYKGTGQNG